MEFNQKSIPEDGWKGFKNHFNTDAVSGFIVFLLALPLSLGIAKASDFPSPYGPGYCDYRRSGGKFFCGSKLTIKGPAAGLIVIVMGSVADFGGAEQGWHYTLGAIFVAALIQILFGLFKWGKLVDVFPLSAVHGMLAAIGIIIILKQIPVLLDIDPAKVKGKSSFQLIAALPDFFIHWDKQATFIGVLSLLIMIFWTKLKIPYLSKLPASLVVLFVAIPAELMMDFQHTEPAYALVDIRKFSTKHKDQY